MNGILKPRLEDQLKLTKSYIGPMKAQEFSVPRMLTQGVISDKDEPKKRLGVPPYQSPP
jgi:hypothetical protein